jgi:hypothetical protein
MRKRSLAPPPVVACAVAGCSLASVLAIAQTKQPEATKSPSASTMPYTPKTAWGDPDLRGTYKNVSMYPLEAREQLPAEGGPAPATPATAKKRVDAGAGPEHWYEVPMGGTTPMVVDPPDHRVPYQPWARELNTEINKHQGENPEVKIKRENLDHRVRCLPSGSPRVTTPCAYCGYQILQGPGFVAFFYEWNHLVQYVPLDGSAHPDPSIQLWMGDARGHWEGNTLVVDVANFNDKTWVARGAAIHSSAMHIVERYTAIDKDTIGYEVKVEDPQVFTQPWTMRFPAFARYPKGEELFEYACAEGNAIDETVFGETKKK